MIDTLLIGATPLLLATLIRMLVARRPHRPTGALRDLRDLVTLRMVLLDSLPEERAVLLNAHRDWRSASPSPTSESAAAPALAPAPGTPAGGQTRGRRTRSSPARVTRD